MVNLWIKFCTSISFGPIWFALCGQESQYMSKYFFAYCLPACIYGSDFLAVFVYLQGLFEETFKFSSLFRSLWTPSHCIAVSIRLLWTCPSNVHQKLMLAWVNSIELSRSDITDCWSLTTDFQTFTHRVTFNREIIASLISFWYLFHHLFPNIRCPENIVWCINFIAKNSR